MNKKKEFNKFLTKYKRIIEKVQLTFFYSVSVILLIANSKQALDKHLYIISGNKLIKRLLRNRVIRFFSAPDRAMYWNMFCHELLIRRDVFSTTNLVKLNVVLFCMITMVNSLIVTYWNTFFIPEHEELVILAPTLPMIYSETLYAIIFTMTLLSYTACYLQSLMGFRPKHPYFLRTLIAGAEFAIDKKKFRDLEKEKFNA